MKMSPSGTGSGYARLSVGWQHWLMNSNLALFDKKLGMELFISSSRLPEGEAVDAFLSNHRLSPMRENNKQSSNSAPESKKTQICNCQKKKTKVWQPWWFLSPTKPDVNSKNTATFWLFSKLYYSISLFYLQEIQMEANIVSLFTRCLISSDQRGSVLYQCMEPMSF